MSMVKASKFPHIAEKLQIFDSLAAERHELSAR